ncbi:PREDICTED: cyclin-C1-2-like isoform X7 [Tarenaya hassleriana]|uniref:cyclin-C1-2-like isoform X7 n=1 Tax=Tarenaya hassleriana TaxID=28532 RepID=UPI0008FCFEFE|nr:PREDICTED: cyclin-C1-2-like isoform X7 [Tarenaya hassleriana]
MCGLLWTCAAETLGWDEVSRAVRTSLDVCDSEARTGPCSSGLVRSFPDVCGSGSRAGASFLGHMRTSSFTRSAVSVPTRTDEHKKKRKSLRVKNYPFFLTMSSELSVQIVKSFHMSFCQYVFYICTLYACLCHFPSAPLLIKTATKCGSLDLFLPFFSTYRLLQDAGINDTSMTHLSWGLVNDTYRMDLILVHPPYLIALACVYIASVYKEKDIRSWLEELCVDMNVVKNIAMEILDFYENHRTITEERVHSAFSKLGKKP